MTSHTNLMTSLVKLTNSKHGSVGSHWFQFQREMRLKSLHKKNLVKAKKIIVDSIEDHLIPHVSSLDTPKYMFDSLIKLFEGKNINQKMTLRK